MGWLVKLKLDSLLYGSEKQQMHFVSFSRKNLHSPLPSQQLATPLLNQQVPNQHNLPLWEPTSNFDRFLAWMWGPPGCANGQTEQDVPDDSSLGDVGTVKDITD